MAKLDPFKLSQDVRGNFRRVIGTRQVGEEFRQATFYLGRDRAAAYLAVVKLERCWDAVHDKWYRTSPHETPRACWDEVTYEIGKAVACGARRVELEYPYRDQLQQLPYDAQQTAILHWLGELRDQFKAVEVQLDLKDERLAARVGDFAEDELAKAEAKVAEVKRLMAAPDNSGLTLRAALDAYEARLRRLYKDGDGVTPSGRAFVQRVVTVRAHLADKEKTALSHVGTAFLDEWVAYWQARPKLVDGQTASATWARHCIKTIRAFVRWLNRAELGWEKPRTYEVVPVKVRATEDEIAASEDPPRYKLAEVPLLWENARPLDRVFILLGLNCGFGLGEVKTLRIKQIKWRGEAAFIKRKRVKTGVWGRWQLWPETIRALRWYMEKARPDSASPYVFLRPSGAPLHKRTKGGNPNNDIVNAWSRLYQRIVKDARAFPKLSFNKLRKTGASFMRRRFSDETTDRYLAHGGREMIDHYAAKAFRCVTRALRRYHQVVAPLLAGVADPFPEVAGRALNVKVSRGTIQRIQELRAQGYKLEKVAELCKVSMWTVRRWEKATL